MLSLVIGAQGKKENMILKLQMKFLVRFVPKIYI